MTNETTFADYEYTYMKSEYFECTNNVYTIKYGVKYVY